MVFGSFGMAACRKGVRNLRTVGGLGLPYRPWLSSELMPKRHIQNDRKRSMLFDQSVVQSPAIHSILYFLVVLFYLSERGIHDSCVYLSSILL